MSQSLDRAALDALFAPKSVAFIGASDKSMFSKIAFDMMTAFGGPDRLHLVNPNRPEVHGWPTYPSLSEIPGGADCVFVMVPQAMVPAAIDDAAAVGARAAVVLSSGYAEVGLDGARAQQELVEQCRAHGITLLGPNHLGFANVRAGIAPCATPGIPPADGGLALISQSGALAGTFTQFARAHGVSFSFLVTTGNEAMVAAEDVLEYVLEDPMTKAVSIFAETIRKPEVFLRAVRRAVVLGKAVVMLKAGSSELSVRTAAAHTGALVGDDAVIDAMLRQEGVIRVAHMEELLVTGHLAAHTGVWQRPGVAVSSISGGACDVVADRAADLGLPLPELASQTLEALDDLVSDFGTAQNPLDVTGAAILDHDLMGRITAALAADPAVGFVGVVGCPVPSMPGVGAALAAAPVPGAYMPAASLPLAGSPAEEAVRSAGLVVLPSARDGLEAMAHLSGWSTRVGQLRAAATSTALAPTVQVSAQPGVNLSEYEVRRVLESAGVPVVPYELTASAEQARAAAATWTGPSALKIVSPDIAHKTESGGVRLGVPQDDVGEAYDQIIVAVTATQPRARLDGVLVSPMRSGGTELLVGVTRDPEWGLVLAVALGGIYVEVLEDSALLRLPAARADIRRNIAGLRGAALLAGVRGGAAADLDRLTDVVVSVCALATSLGDRLKTLEINPLRVDGTVVEALDALIEWEAE
jgi:acyl-CoA synthetase (NDP forming)